MPDAVVPPMDVTSYGVAPNYGAFTSDYVPDYPQIIKFKESIELRKAWTRQFLQMFCEITFDSQIEVATSGVRMQEVGRDMAAPNPQHTPRYMLDINPPRKFQAGTAVTQDAFYHGMSAAKLQQQTMAPLVADQIWCEQFIMGTALTPAGFYDADLTPPPEGANTFTSAHDHYVVFANSGNLTPEVSSFAKWHIAHHGYAGGSVVCFTNSATGTLFEQEFGTISATNYYQTMPFIEALIKYGFQPGMPLSGVPTLLTDWVPIGYALYMALGEEKPMVWKPENRPETVDLLFTQEVPIPNSQYKWWGTATRYGAPTIQSPGQGVAVQLDGAVDGDAYTAPSGILDISV